MENIHNQKFKLEPVNYLKTSEVQLLPGPFVFDVHGIFTKEVYDELLKSESDSELILMQLLINMAYTVKP
jgi:hypothetical protein